MSNALAAFILSQPDVPQKAPAADHSPFWNSFRPVPYSEDLDRVLNLPRRPGRVEDWVDDWTVQTLSELVRRPGGTIVLRRLQVGALIEAAQNNGLLGPIGVGEGKTIISFLLPVVMKSRVSVLMVPPSLKKKAVEIEYPVLSRELVLPALAGYPIRHGDEPGVLHVVSYSQLSSQSGAKVLEDIAPDLIICDEAQSLRDSSSARTKRFRRYLKKHPGTRTVYLSGSMVNRSLEDFAHFATAALGDGAPVPQDWTVLQSWVSALDVNAQAPAGELRKLCKDESEDVRVGYQRRLRETPGVIASGSEVLPTGLVITDRPIVVPKAVETALDDLRNTWETPGGEVLSYALDKVRAACQLSAGLYTRWIWPRGESPDVIREWKDARREWHKEIREYLKHQAKDYMDSPGFLESAAHRWHFGYEHEGRRIDPHTRAGPKVTWASETYLRWIEIEPQAVPDDEVVWIDTFLAQDSAAFGQEGPKIIWYEHDGLGRKIAELGGFRHFGGGQKASGELLHLAAGRDAGRSTIVCSLKAHHHGKNLQGWNEMLVTTFPSSGTMAEQMLGRCHRQGQAADEVLAHVYRHTPEMRRSLLSAIKDAKYTEEVLGSVQKLCYATYTFDPKR